MSRPFALWITDSYGLVGKRSGTVFQGPCLGRCPEPGEVLTYFAPLGSPLRLHCGAIAGVPRGREDAPASIVVRERLGNAAGLLVGGLLVESGIRVRAVSAQLASPRSTTQGAKFVAGGEHSWGIVRVAGVRLLAVLVGGEPPNDFWDELLQIDLQDGTSILRTEIRPRTIGHGLPWIWTLPVLGSYPRDRGGVGLVGPPIGWIRPGPWDVWVDGMRRLPNALQQKDGLPNLRFEDLSSASELAAVDLPFAA